MKYLVIKKYIDMGKTRRVGEVVELVGDRAKSFLGKGLIEPYIEEAMLEEKTEKAVKRTRRKKKDEDRCLQEQSLEEGKA